MNVVEQKVRDNQTQLVADYIKKKGWITIRQADTVVEKFGNGQQNLQEVRT